MNNAYTNADVTAFFLFWVVIILIIAFITLYKSAKKNDDDDEKNNMISNTFFEEKERYKNLYEQLYTANVEVKKQIIKYKKEKEMKSNERITVMIQATAFNQNKMNKEQQQEKLHQEIQIFSTIKDALLESQKTQVNLDVIHDAEVNVHKYISSNIDVIKNRPAEELFDRLTTILDEILNGRKIKSNHQTLLLNWADSRIQIAKNDLKKFYKKPSETKQLPKSFHALGIVQGFYVSDRSEILEADELAEEENKNIFPSKKEAEAALALSQLCQLRDFYNDGWKPNTKKKQLAYCIGKLGGKITIGQANIDYGILYFKTSELMNEFKTNFKELIEQAEPFL